MQVFDPATRGTGVATRGDSIVRYITSPVDVPLFDPAWNGTWTISKAIGKPALLNGVLSLSETHASLVASVSPEDCATLVPGDYVLSIRVNTNGFSKEIWQETLTINEAGSP